jgi:hypothetical protein
MSTTEGRPDPQSNAAERPNEPSTRAEQNILFAPVIQVANVMGGKEAPDPPKEKSRLEKWSQMAAIIGTPIAVIGLVLMFLAVPEFHDWSIRLIKRVSGFPADSTAQASKPFVEVASTQIPVTQTPFTIIKKPKKQQAQKTWRAAPLANDPTTVAPATQGGIGNQQTETQSPPQQSPKLGLQTCAAGSQCNQAFPGGTITNPTVNNYGSPIPAPAIVNLVMKALPNTAPNPGYTLTFSVDHEFPDPKFLVLCDRPCTMSLVDVQVIRTDPAGMHSQDNPNLTGLRLGALFPLSAKVPVTLRITSKDTAPISIIQFWSYVEPLPQ